MLGRCGFGAVDEESGQGVSLPKGTGTDRMEKSPPWGQVSTVRPPCGRLAIPSAALQVLSLHYSSRDRGSFQAGAGGVSPAAARLRAAAQRLLKSPVPRLSSCR